MTQRVGILDSYFTASPNVTVIAHWNAIPSSLNALPLSSSNSYSDFRNQVKLVSLLSGSHL